MNSLENSKLLFQQLNLDFTSQTIDFLNASNKSRDVNDYYSVYKGSSSKDKWKKELPEYIIKEIYFDLKNTRLERFLK